MDNRTFSTRREFLQQTGLGFGALALSCLVEDDRLLASPGGGLCTTRDHG